MIRAPSEAACWLLPRCRRHIRPLTLPIPLALAIPLALSFSRTGVSLVGRGGRRCPRRVARCGVERAVLALLLMVAAPNPIAAQTETAAVARADAIASQLNCPICQGYTLRDCPLPICAQMRDEIRLMLDDGLDESAVIEHYVELYGPQVLNMPPARGPFLAAWILPVAVLAGGTLVVARALAAATDRSRSPAGRRDPKRALDQDMSAPERRTNRPSPSPSPSPSPADAEAIARIERLLQERDAR